jgi:hypothetical protein
MDNENMALRFNNDMTDVSSHSLRRLHFLRGYGIFEGVETVAGGQSERTGGEKTVERYVSTEGKRKSGSSFAILLYW